MRRLVAAFVVGIALVGAAYLGSLRLGDRGVFPCVNTGFGPPAHACGRHYRTGWQIPASILIGVLGVVSGLIVLRGGRVLLDLRLREIR